MRGIGKRLWAIVVPLVIAGMLLSACGSSSKKTSTAGSSTTSSASGRKVIHVFGWGFETVAGLSQVPPITFEVNEPKVAARAIARDPSMKVSVDYTFCDTKETTNGALGCAQKAVSPTGCNGSPCDVGLLIQDLADAVTVPFIAKAGIPIVGLSPQDNIASANTDLFCVGPTLGSALEGMGYVFKKEGASKVGIITFTSPVAQAYTSAIEAGLKAQGLSVSGTTNVPITTVNPAPAVATVLGHGADGLAPLSGPSIAAAMKYVATAYKGVKVVLPSFAIAPTILGALPTSTTNGVGVSAWQQPTSATNLPGVAQYIKEGGQAVEGAYPHNDSALMAWLATHFIANVANTISGPITRASLRDALQSANNVNMGGIVPPWNASQRGKKGAAPCSPYNVFVPETLQNGRQVADQPGVFLNPLTGKVAYTVATTK